MCYDLKTLSGTSKTRKGGVSNEGDDFGKFKIRLSTIKDQIYIVGNIHDNPELLK